MTTRPMALAAVVLIALMGCSGGDVPEPTLTSVVVGADIVEAKVLETWPLTIDEGVLECWPDESVTFTVDGQTYAVNGHARGQITDNPGWADITDIALPGDGLNGTTLDLLDFVGYATTIC